MPDNPEAWLLTAAPALEQVYDAVLSLTTQDFPDERLELMFVCAYPAIDETVRTPLTLQTILGRDAARIACAFLVEAPAMSQRLVRAKAKIRDAGFTFEVPVPRCPRSGSAELEASSLLIVRLVPGLQRLRIPGALIAVAVMGAVSFHLFTPPGIDPNIDGAGLFAMALVVWLCPIAMQIAGRGVLIEPDSAVARVLLPHRALSTEGPALIPARS